MDTAWDVVGGRVRAARVAEGISVRELARRIGVSASHVSQVERGIGAFSVPALYAVARELRVSMHDILDGAGVTPSPTSAPTLASEDDLTRQGVVQRVADRPSIQLSSGPRWSRLTLLPEADAEFLEVVYAPRTARSESDIQHEGREYGVVVSGSLSVEVDGVATVLDPGDSIVFDSSRPHRFWNETDEEVRAFWFVRDRAPWDVAPHA